MNTLMIFIAAGCVMWSLRASVIVLADGRALPDIANRTLGYAKHAVLAALLMTLLRNGLSANGFGYLPHLAAAMGAVTVAWVTRGMVRTMVAGMVIAGTLAVIAAHFGGHSA